MVQALINWVNGWGLWGWSGWQWAGWVAVSALGTILAAAAATFALIYFRTQSHVMAAQLKAQLEDQAAERVARLEEAQMSVTPLVSLVGGPVAIAPVQPPRTTFVFQSTPTALGLLTT